MRCGVSRWISGLAAAAAAVVVDVVVVDVDVDVDVDVVFKSSDGTAVEEELFTEVGCEKESIDATSSGMSFATPIA